MQADRDGKGPERRGSSEWRRRAGQRPRWIVELPLLLLILVLAGVDFFLGWGWLGLGGESGIVTPSEELIGDSLFDWSGSDGAAAKTRLPAGD